MAGHGELTEETWGVLATLLLSGGRRDRPWDRCCSDTIA